MTQEEYKNEKYQFERALNFMLIASRERILDGSDFKNLNWIVRNLDRIRNNKPEDLEWDEKKKEIIVQV